MSTPQELRQTAKQFRDTASLIYEREVREEYHTALDYLYEATRRELYASMIEGKEKEMERCIALHPKREKVEEKIDRVIHENYTVRDMRGRYHFTSVPYAQRKEEAEIARHQSKQREEKREEERVREGSTDHSLVREGFKALPSQFTFKL